ncbi:alpha/beta hydrolase [Planobispora rosea]|uniref:Alpha/beta hydrolase n=1 Tax=Planobispora rosea TaxID=35762 RepID=A0A8J3WBF2_PLARO|nr:alpha/beta hydrolase [Planobispora rosea]GGS74955.1 alpha/beta hydrolase [Planobispora rosea]GIH81796.1 alpha/beta hydrolase [Planobispora rosea]
MESGPVGQVSRVSQVGGTVLTDGPGPHMVTSADGTGIAYDRTGAGPALILVQGAFSTRTDPIMAGIAAALESRFTVINYDRRGRGDSGDTAPYAVQREIEDLRSLIDAAGGKAMVFGGSSGGALALEAAAAGAPISKLAVFEPPYVADSVISPIPTYEELSALVEQGRRGEAVEVFLTRGAEMPAEAVAGMKAQPFWAGIEAVAHTLAYEAAVVGPGPVPAHRLAAISVPTLVLAGSGSSPRMQTAAQAVADAVPGARVHRLEGQAHGQLDPEVLGAALTGFFSG